MICASDILSFSESAVLTAVFLIALSVCLFFSIFMCFKIHLMMTSLLLFISDCAVNHALSASSWSDSEMKFWSLLMTAWEFSSIMTLSATLMLFIIFKASHISVSFVSKTSTSQSSNSSWFYHLPVFFCQITLTSHFLFFKWELSDQNIKFSN